MSLILESERLILRRPHIDEVGQYLDAINHPEVYEIFLERDDALTKEEALEQFSIAERRETNGNGYELCIFLKESDDIAGGVNIWVESDDMKAEIGFWCTLRHQGKGIASEGLKCVCEWAFREVGLERIFGACASDNAKSARVMERAGMRLEGILRHDCKRGDSYVDSLLYGMIREDWNQK